MLLRQPCFLASSGFSPLHSKTSLLTWQLACTLWCRRCLSAALVCTAFNPSKLPCLLQWPLCGRPQPQGLLHSRASASLLVQVYSRLCLNAEWAVGGCSETASLAKLPRLCAALQQAEGPAHRSRGPQQGSRWCLTLCQRCTHRRGPQCCLKAWILSCHRPSKMLATRLLQVSPKSCGHVRNKQVVGRAEAVQRVRAAVDARREGQDIVIVARTDARQADSLQVGCWLAPEQGHVQCVSVLGRNSPIAGSLSLLPSNIHQQTSYTTQIKTLV